MKKVLLVFSIIYFNSNAQITNDAVGIIKFESNLTESLSGLAPTVNGNYTFVDDAFGNRQSAIKLSAQLNYGNPEFSRMGSSDFTIAFWFRKDGSLWQEKPIIEKEFIGQFALYSEGYGASYQDWIGDGSMQLGFKTDGASAFATSSMGTIPDDTWTHIALSYDRSDSLIKYINGERLQFGMYIGDQALFLANMDSSELIIGWSNMSLDDIYFFKTALNDSEILELYNALASASIDENQLDGNISIFPNPCSGKFTVDAKSETIESIQILDATGRQVQNEKVNGGTQNINFSIDRSGIYLVRINSDKGNYMKLVEIL